MKINRPGFISPVHFGVLPSSSKLIRRWCFLINWYHRSWSTIPIVLLRLLSSVEWWNMFDLCWKIRCENRVFSETLFSSIPRSMCNESFSRYVRCREWWKKSCSTNGQPRLSLSSFISIVFIRHCVITIRKGSIQQRMNYERKERSNNNNTGAVELFDLLVFIKFRSDSRNFHRISIWIWSRNKRDFLPMWSIVFTVIGYWNAKYFPLHSSFSNRIRFVWGERCSTLDRFTGRCFSLWFRSTSEFERLCSTISFGSDVFVSIASDRRKTNEYVAMSGDKVRNHRGKNVESFGKICATSTRCIERLRSAFRLFSGSW